jgi:hypothetical protein
MDTTAPSGELLFHVFGALSQYERALTQERVIADHHHARVSCQGDQIRHARDHIGGLRNRHELGEGIDLIIHHQQRGAPGINVRKLRHGFLPADGISFLRHAR